jgi:hypothetical protein
MTKFVLFALLGLAAGAVWAWLRRRGPDRESAQSASPRVVSLDSVEEKPAEPPDEVDIPVAQEEVRQQPIPVAVPESTNGSAVPAASELQPVLQDSGDMASEQPIPPAVGATEAIVKQEAETAVTLEEEVPKTNVPLAVPSEMESSSTTPSGQTDTPTISPPKSTFPAAVKASDPGAQISHEEEPKEADITPQPPTYRPTAPSATTAPSRPRRSTGSHPTQTSNADLRLRVQLVFGRGGVVRNLALAPDRRDGMPSEIEITGTQGELHLTELRDDCYEPLMLADASNALLQGVEWRGRGDALHWRWVLGGRELYVLARGDDFGLHGFVSTARLWLNARHVVLATKWLREEVLSALAEAGCATPEIGDDTTPGVPSGWLLFRDVIPTRAVPMRDDHDILNSLCPAHEIEPHFVGGIRLERNTWLAGFPPRIRFTGEFANGFQVKIDGQPAHPANDGGFEVTGWDSEGEHRLWFGDRAETYSLCTMGEAWEHWHAHDFGTGAAICGASTNRLDGARWRQVCVPASNPLLIGARPGEIFRCRVRNGVNTGRIIALVPFAPVWALPMDRLSEKNCSIRLVLVEFIEPTKTLEQFLRKRKNDSAFRRWAFSIRNARRKQLTLAVQSEETMSLWRRYGVVAKHLWRQLR